MLRQIAGKDKANTALARQVKRAGKAIPKTIADRPVLYPGQVLFLDGFYELTNERKSASTPIPTTAMLLYCQAYGFGPDLTQLFVTLVNRMDLAYLAYRDDNASRPSDET